MLLPPPSGAHRPGSGLRSVERVPAVLAAATEVGA